MHIWIIIGITFFILEIFTPGFFVASLGVGSFVAAFFARQGSSFNVQLVALTAGTFLIFVLIRPFMGLLQKKSDKALETGIYALIGQSCKVIKKIDNIENSGRIKVGGEDWKASSSAGEKIDEGTIVTIDKIEGVTVYVTKKEIKRDGQ